MIALTLYRRDWGEFDQMISVYTRESGKLEVIAKGIKKITSKNSANLEIPCLAEIEVAQGKDLPRLTRVQLVDAFKNIRSDLAKIFIAGYAAQVLDKFTLSGEKDEKIFDLLLGFFNFLNSESKIDPLNSINSYLLKLWGLFGFGSELNKFSKLQPDALFRIINKSVQAHNGKPLPDFIKNAKVLGII